METMKTLWGAMTPEERNRWLYTEALGKTLGICDGSEAEQPGTWFCTRCGFEGDYTSFGPHQELPPRYTEDWNAAMQLIEWSKHLRSGSRWQIDVILDSLVRQAMQREAPEGTYALKLDYLSWLSPEIIGRTIYAFVKGQRQDYTDSVQPLSERDV